MRTALARRVNSDHPAFAVVIPEGDDEKRRGMLAFPKPVPMLLEDVATVTLERTPWPLELYGLVRRPDLGAGMWTVDAHVHAMPWTTARTLALRPGQWPVDGVLELPQGDLLPLGTLLEVV